MADDSLLPAPSALALTVTVSSQQAFVPVIEALASRVGEYVGCAAEHAQHLGRALGQALTGAFGALGGQGPGRFDIVFQGNGRVLRVDVACRFPLPAGVTLEGALGGAEGLETLRKLVDRVEFGDTDGCPFCRLTRQIRDAH